MLADSDFCKHLVGVLGFGLHLRTLTSSGEDAFQFSLRSNLLAGIEPSPRLRLLVRLTAAIFWDE
jgi:hypothetical protein